MNRRQFVRSTGAGAAAVLLSQSGLPATESSPAWPLRLSTSTIQLRDLPIEQACARIASLGFEAVDIWSAYEGCPHLDDIAQRLGSTGLKELLARHQLKLYSFSTYVGGYARYADLLGGAGGGVALQGSAGPCKPEELTARMKSYLASLKPLVELAEKNKSYLAIENHGQSLLDSLDSFKAFVDLNQSPRLGIALAPFHLQAIQASVTDAIRICGPQLLFFYAWQNAPEMGQLPGHGPTDFKPWLAALAGIRYPWYVNPFMHGHTFESQMMAGLAKARDYLRRQTPA